jgi:hypothetical protein
MVNSNWNSNCTIRSPRTCREAYGHDIQFESRDPDRLVGWACLLLAVFVAGMLVGGVL